MKFDPQQHHRHSIRLKGYDYAQAGAYFITIVTCQRERLFGEIVDGIMHLSAMGQIADEHWRAIPEHFPQVDLGAHVIMPNHGHGIIVIRGDGMATNSSPSVGATQWVARTDNSQWVARTDNSQWVAPAANGPARGSIGAIIGSYKMSVTCRIQKELGVTGIWQRNYYEHIIRDAEEYRRIHLYIESNVDNWANDEENR